MRFKRSTDPFPRKGGNWLTTTGDNDHRIVQLVMKYAEDDTDIYVYDGNTMTPLENDTANLIGDPYDTIFFRPHVFYGNTTHQLYASGISYRPIAVRNLGDSGDGVETFFINPKNWEVAGVWEDTEFDPSDWQSHANNQDLKKIFDDWSLPRNVDRTPGKPNKWVWNETSPNRWQGIKIDGTDHSIWLGDERSVQQMLNILDANAYDAINNQFILS